MNNTTRIFLTTLCAGVLLTGIGAGIAFGEYSSMDYREMEVPGSGEPVQNSADLSIPEEGNIYVYVPDQDALSIQPDENVPMGTVSISARCNPPAAEIIIEGPDIIEYVPEYDTFTQDDYVGADNGYAGNGYAGEDNAASAGNGFVNSDDRPNATGKTQPEPETITHIRVYPVSSGNGIQTFAMYKDQFLDGLKEGVICLPPDYYESLEVVIRVNPEDIERVSLG